MSQPSVFLAPLIDRITEWPALAPLVPVIREAIAVIEREPLTAAILVAVAVVTVITMVGLRAATMPLAMGLVAAGAVLETRAAMAGQAAAGSGLVAAYAGAAIALFGLARAERRRRVVASELQASVADIGRQIDGFLTALDRRSRAADRRITALQPGAFRDVLEPDETAAAR